VHAGAVITGVAGVSLHSSADMRAVMKGRRPGDAITIQWRDTAGEHSAQVILAPGPPA
jgi:PDZ domain-containing secreted protein